MSSILKLTGNKSNLFYSGVNFGLRLANNIVMYSILARILDLETFGIVSLLVLTVFLANTFIDYGHRTIVIKDISLNPSKTTAEYISNKVATKLPLFLCLFLIVSSYFLNNDFWGINPFVLFTFFLSSFFISLSNFNFALFYALNKYYLESLSMTVNTVLLFVGVALTYAYGNVNLFLIFYLIGALGMFIYSMKFVKENYNLGWKNYFFSFDRTSLLKEYRIALPFALIFYADAVFGGFDSYFIESYYNKADLGHYEGIKKVINGLAILAVIAMSAIMPAISRIAKFGTLEGVKKVFYAFVAVCFVGLGVFLFYYFFNEFFVSVLLGSGFDVIVTWDTHIGMYTLSRYVRIVPAVYLVMAGFHTQRLSIVVLSLAIGLYIFVMLVPAHNMKYAFKMITYCNVFLAVLYTLVFLSVLGYKYKKLKRVQRSL